MVGVSVRMIGFIFSPLPSFIVGHLIEIYIPLLVFVVAGEFIASFLLTSMDVLSNQKEDP